MTGWKIHHSIGNTSSNGGFSSVMLVFVRVRNFHTPNSSPLKNGWLEDDRFLLGPGRFSGVNSLLNFGRVFEIWQPTSCNSSKFCQISYVVAVEHPLFFHVSKVDKFWRCKPTSQAQRIYKPAPFQGHLSGQVFPYRNVADIEKLWIWLVKISERCLFLLPSYFLC